MKFVIKIFTVLGTVLMMSGCASYVEPPSSPQTATIQGSVQSKSLVTWNSTDITSIDGKSLGMKWSQSSKFNISPGKHKIIVNASFNRGFGSGGPYYALIQIPFIAKPGTHYIAKSSPKGIKIRAWIENMINNKRISVIRSQNYQVAPRESMSVVTIVKK